MTLWRGWQPTVTRAIVLNAAQLGVYSQSKQMLIQTGYFEVRLYSPIILLPYTHP